MRINPRRVLFFLGLGPKLMRLVLRRFIGSDDMMVSDIANVIVDIVVDNDDALCATALHAFLEVVASFGLFSVVISSRIKVY